MIADLEFIKESFRHFNLLCFGGKLPEPIFMLGRAKGSLGRMEHKRNGSYVLRISRSFDLPRETLEDVVIHEMIHYHIMLHGKRLRSKPHGPLFRQMMEDINRIFGRHISITFKTNESQGRPARREREVHNIILSTLKDGRRGITIPLPASYQRIWRTLPHRYRIASMEQYSSTDPFFNKFPSSRSAVIYKISEEELLVHI